MNSNKLLLLAAGMISGLIFAPTFFTPCSIALSLLCFQVQQAPNAKGAFKVGFIFGFGHFLTSMYWIGIALTVFIDEFWWALPLGILGPSCILACFIASSCALSWITRKDVHYQLIFCIWWIVFEWARSWVFTGLPWNLLGYAFSFSDALIQPASVIGTYGLSYIVIYISTCFYYYLSKQPMQLKISIITACIIFFAVLLYGNIRLVKNPTSYTSLKVRLVQPSIPQRAKWNVDEFWDNFDKHIKLSHDSKARVDLIIWPEAAIVVPYNYPLIKNKLINMLKNTNSVLISGGVTENVIDSADTEIFTTMYALNQKGKISFNYHKSHLVPFGEYMPLKDILPLKKITPGFLDYSEGEGKLVYLKEYNLRIRALICYEAIFPELARSSTKDTDVMINITNDAWFGRSSGPYQHFQISKMRAVENGLPMLRVANNGISALIDPVGRIIEKLPLNKIANIEGILPKKLKFSTLYSEVGNTTTLIIVFLVLLIQSILKFILRFNRNEIRAS